MVLFLRSWTCFNHTINTKQNEKPTSTFERGVWGRKCFHFATMGEDWEKMADFRNHRRFSLKCLSYDVIPVSIRLKTNVRTAKGLEIIKKTERKLLNKHIRSINNTIELYMYDRDSLVLQLEEKLDNNNNNNQESGRVKAQ